MNQGYQQATIPVSDPQTFGAVRSAIEATFAAAKVTDFLKSLDRARLRIRDFEVILGKGMLGPQAKGAYPQLGDGDQGMIRELYLAALEHVSPDLRQKFFKLYAYY